MESRDNPFDLYMEEYEGWFRENETLFRSELLALKELLPRGRKGVEIGVGSGIFAEKLGIKYGIDPAPNMLERARARNINVVQGVAEALPYVDKSFDFAVFITSICFIKKPTKALEETYRILKSGGSVVVAFIAKDSDLGQIIMQEKEDSKFYKSATLYTIAEIKNMMRCVGFKTARIVHTLTDLHSDKIETPKEGIGKGSFVVVEGVKYA